MEKAELEQVMILLQRRYNALREIDRLTDDLQDAFARHDEVSASLLLDMRAEEIQKTDSCMGQIWDLANSGASSVEIRRLVKEDPYRPAIDGHWEENKIYEIRRKTTKLLDALKDKDRRLSLSVGGEKSFYKKQSAAHAGFH